MHNATTTTLHSLEETRGRTVPEQVKSAVADPLLDEPDERMELFNRLAAVPVRSATVGGGAQRLDMPHIAGVVRTTGNGAATGNHAPARPKGATVALADGTRITFAAVELAEVV